MSIRLQVLGRAREDNALLATMDQGSRLVRLLFDCGYQCPDYLTRSTLRGVDHLFLSHFHMDHICGFDGFFRVNHNRLAPPVRVWGPVGAINLLHHRFRGCELYPRPEHPGTWIVSEVGEEQILSASFSTKDCFEHRHSQEPVDHPDFLVDEPGYSVSSILLDHGIVSVGFVVREKPLPKVETSRLAGLGLSPGPWIQHVKDENRDDSETLLVQGQHLTLGDLRAKLLMSRPGESFAYLTDFRITSDTEMERIADFIQGCTVLVCESQYRSEDLGLARDKNHMTGTQAAALAARAQVGRLILIHVSERYRSNEMLELLHEARRRFPETFFPPEWEIDV